MDRIQSDEMLRCIAECERCRDTCVRTIAHGLRRGGHYAAADHMLRLLDCADICAASASFMLRDSSLHDRLCAVCAEVCDACAAACDAVTDDHMIRGCAEECRRCARSCREMAAAGATRA